jgi:TldD protein
VQNRFSFKRLLISAFVLLPMFNGSVHAQTDSLLIILRTEMERENTQLKKAEVPPYYINYLVHDLQSANISASFGSLTYSNEDRARTLDVNIKIGDYQFDNTHQLEEFDGGEIQENYNYEGGGNGYLPIENGNKAISFLLWKSTEAAYRKALATYKVVTSATSKPVKSSVPDFSKEAAEKYYERPLPTLTASYSRSKWEENARKSSALFLKYKDIVEATVSLSAILDRKYFVSTEGTEVVENQLQFYVFVHASVRAVDGDILPLHKSYFGFDESQLPTFEVMARDIDEMIVKLNKLKTAPIAEPYSGPAILDAQTSGVFFHEIFGHRVEGHRLRDETDGQTFKAQIDQKVLPPYLSVIFDPTMVAYQDTPLNGYYHFDDEGVRGRRVLSVDKGILKAFLMSRSPLEKQLNSNGHGRASAGASSVSRQSNLIVESTKKYTSEDLRKMLIKECKKQGKTYGYLFRDVMGGFTNTARYMPNAFNIFPTEVYRIYTDGRPDELVRGVDLIGTPLAMFSEIAAAGNKPGVFHGFCGAESGSVPVSAIAPALLVKKIETQKKMKSQLDETILTRPASN